MSSVPRLEVLARRYIMRLVIDHQAQVWRIRLALLHFERYNTDDENSYDFEPVALANSLSDTVTAAIRVMDTLLLDLEELRVALRESFPPMRGSIGPETSYGHRPPQ